MNKRESIQNQWKISRALKNGFITHEELEQIFDRINLKYPDNLKSSSWIEMFINLNVKKKMLNISITNNATNEKMQYSYNNFEKAWTYIKGKKQDIKIYYLENVIDRIEDLIEGKINKITAILKNEDETEISIKINISNPVTINEVFNFISQVKSEPNTSKMKTGDRIYGDIEVKKISQ